MIIGLYKIINIINSMNLEKLKACLSGQPAFRYKQADEAIYRQLISDWSEATGFPKDLRERLNKECSLAIDYEAIESDEDDATKALIRLDRGGEVETVLMSHRDGRRTVCVSSQIGCPLGCAFCATGTLGFKRNLEADEIVEQVLFFARKLKEKGEQVSNVVFMGMGEPFLNYENVLAAVRKLNDNKGLSIGARHISISTAGIPDGIKQLAKEGLQINLAISLHSVNDKTRSQIMPINKKYPVSRLKDAVSQYMDTTDRQVMFEYILLAGINDGLADAKKLAEYLGDFPAKLIVVNLVPYNETGTFTKPERSVVDVFAAELEKLHVNTTIRRRFGQDISGACGQLAKKGKKC